MAQQDRLLQFAHTLGVPPQVSAAEELVVSTGLRRGCLELVRPEVAALCSRTTRAREHTGAEFGCAQAGACETP